jgi:beta-galactosidase
MIRLIILNFLLLGSSQVFSQNTRVTLFDDNWTFYKGGVSGADKVDFDDSKWRRIDLPHDWSIEDLPGTNSPFDSNAISQEGGGFTTGGTGWYRKKFKVDINDTAKMIYLQFDGVYMNADVWVNGKHLGNHPYGYTDFVYFISDKIKFGNENIVAVQVKNEGQNSRWYSGSGIYRHVWLKTLEAVHIVQSGNSIATSDISLASAKITIKTGVINENKQPCSVTLQTRILNAKGIEVAKQDSANDIPANNYYGFNGSIILRNPQLWSIETPVLYTVVIEVYQNGKLIDEEKTKFGIRKISFDTANGFQLNDKTLKLKGGCFHNDNGPLGSKAYDRAEERKVELMKASGYNAIRCSHNPPSPAFLNACDSLGMLVIDEAFDVWNEPKMSYDYHLYFDKWWKNDIESMVLRDRNHPCVILWSIGNEIPERATPQGAKTAQMLADYVQGLDSSRPVISAVNNVNEATDPFFAALGVAGYNYAMDHYEPDHKRKPGRIMCGTESFPLEAFENWMAVIDHPWVIGDFVWTGFDYIGEASIGWRGFPQDKNFYPWNLAFCGDIDVCGWKKSQSYYRDALWKVHQVSVFVRPPKPSFELNPKRPPWSKWHSQDVVADWNWKGHENELMEVNVYSSCQEVELFFNGRSLGKKSTGRFNKYTAIWQVAWQPGKLKATGYDDRKKISSVELHTAEEPAQIKLTADRTNIKADGQDLSYVTIELTDDKGYRNPKAENLLKFEIEGPGSIAGVGNANPVSLESFQLPQRKAWQGRCLVIVRSGKKAGDILLKVTSAGLKSSVIRLKSN